MTENISVFKNKDTDFFIQVTEYKSVKYEARNTEFFYREPYY